MNVSIRVLPDAWTFISKYVLSWLRGVSARAPPEPQIRRPDFTITVSDPGNYLN